MVKSARMAMTGCELDYLNVSATDKVCFGGQVGQRRVRAQVPGTLHLGFGRTTLGELGGQSSKGLAFVKYRLGLCQQE